jgi:hypothetical protein
MPDAKMPSRGETGQRADRDAYAGSLSWTGFLAAIWIVGAVVAFAVLFWTAVS